MARQLRIEYRGAFYHIYSRGNQKQPVFLSDEDRQFFIAGLRKAFDKFGVVVHTYCLMPNHFHLILETPLGNLSRMMHFLVTKYTVYFNKKHERQGHLFQGRYKSILVEVVSYARELSRYIHLNPVRKRLVSQPELYPWSSYGFFYGKALPESWMETAVILKLFHDDLSRAKSAYHGFVMKGIGMDVPEPIKQSMRLGILGSEEFVTRIKREYLKEEIEKPDREKPQLRRMIIKLSPSRVLSLTERSLGTRNRFIVPIAVYICHKNSALKLREIGEFFSLSISSVSNACLRAKAAIATNAALSEAVSAIERDIQEGQGEGVKERVKPTFFRKK